MVEYDRKENKWAVRLPGRVPEFYSTERDALKRLEWLRRYFGTGE